MSLSPYSDAMCAATQSYPAFLPPVILSPAKIVYMCTQGSEGERVRGTRTVHIDDGNAASLREDTHLDDLWSRFLLGLLLVIFVSVNSNVSERRMCPELRPLLRLLATVNGLPIKSDSF